MTDDRTDPEITWCILIGIAASYLGFLKMSEQAQQANTAIYGVGDIKEWAIKMANKVIARANTLAIKPSLCAQSVVGDSLAALARTELSGYVLTPIVLE